MTAKEAERRAGAAGGATRASEGRGGGHVARPAGRAGLGERRKQVGRAGCGWGAFSFPVLLGRAPELRSRVPRGHGACVGEGSAVQPRGRGSSPREGGGHCPATLPLQDVGTSPPPGLPRATGFCPQGANTSDLVATSVEPTLIRAGSVVLLIFKKNFTSLFEPN